MDTNKVTVMIVGNDDEEVKTFSVNRTLLINYKTLSYFYFLRLKFNSISLSI